VIKYRYVFLQTFRILGTWKHRMVSDLEKLRLTLSRFLYKVHRVWKRKRDASIFKRRRAARWRRDNVSDSLLCCCISRHHPYRYKILIVSIQDSSPAFARLRKWRFSSFLLASSSFPSLIVDSYRRSEYLRTMRVDGTQILPVFKEMLFDDIHDRSIRISCLE